MLNRYILFDDLIATNPERTAPWSWHTDDNNKEMWPMFIEKIMSTRSNDYNPWPKHMRGFDDVFWQLRYYDYNQGCFHI